MGPPGADLSKDWEPCGVLPGRTGFNCRLRRMRWQWGEPRDGEHFVSASWVLRMAPASVISGLCKPPSGLRIWDLEMEKGQQASCKTSRKRYDAMEETWLEANYAILVCTTE